MTLAYWIVAKRAFNQSNHKQVTRTVLFTLQSCLFAKVYHASGCYEKSKNSGNKNVVFRQQLKAQRVIILSLTFVVCLQVIKIEVCLPVTQDKGQEGENEGIQDAHDGQHIGPAYRAIAQRVFPCLLPTHVSDHLGVPSVWKDHATQHQAHSCRRPHRKKRG